MGLVVIERFSALGEAQIARAALHSAGIPAFVSDEHYGALDWQLQTALQGFRVSVPIEEFNTAAQVILEARRAGAAGLSGAPLDIPPPRRGPRLTALAILMSLSFESAGFLVPAALAKPTAWRWIGLTPFAVTAVLTWLTIFAGWARGAMDGYWFGPLFAGGILLWWILRDLRPVPLAERP